MSDNNLTPRIPRTSKIKEVGDNCTFYYTDDKNLIFIVVDPTKEIDIKDKKNLRVASTEGNRTLDREIFGTMKIGINAYKDRPDAQ